MNKEELLQLVKIKINRLLSQGVKIEFLPNEKYRIEQVKIGEIIICKDSISNGEIDFWDAQVLLTFMKNPVLNGKEAEACLEELLGGQETLMETYLKNL